MDSDDFAHMSKIEEESGVIGRVPAVPSSLRWPDGKTYVLPHYTDNKSCGDLKAVSAAPIGIHIAHHMFYRFITISN